MASTICMWHVSPCFSLFFFSIKEETILFRCGSSYNEDTRCNMSVGSRVDCTKWIICNRFRLVIWCSFFPPKLWMCSAIYGQFLEAFFSNFLNKTFEHKKHFHLNHTLVRHLVIFYFYYCILKRIKNFWPTVYYILMQQIQRKTQCCDIEKKNNNLFLNIYRKRMHMQIL